jgi:hypothetical protein
MKSMIVLLLFFPGLAFAEVYQCKGPDGKISFSDQLCPTGSTAKKVDINLPKQSTATPKATPAPNSTPPRPSPPTGGLIAPPTNPNI